MINRDGQVLSYDAENRLITTDYGLRTTDYLYDGDGGRVKSTVHSSESVVEKRYIGSLFEEKYEDGTKKTSTKHIYAGSNKVCSITTDYGLSTTDYAYIHSDHLGSSNIITDKEGNKVSQTEYQPYGKVSFEEQAASYQPRATSYLFTGKELDSNGLYYYGARYYDPEIGRFISADPTIQHPNDPQDFNRYTYCRNNPINYIDPSGYGWFKKFIGKILGAIAGVVTGVVTGNFMLGFQVFNFVNSTFTAATTNNWGSFAGGIIGVAVGGALGVWAASGVAGFLGDSAFTFGGGFLIGATEFGIAGFGAGFGSALGGGTSFGGSLKSGLITGGVSAIIGGIVEGSYLAGWQNSLHGMDREAVGKAAKVERQLSLEIVRKPLPKLAKDFVGGEGGDHWGLRIRDNYNEFNGTWDFDYTI